MVRARCIWDLGSEVEASRFWALRLELELRGYRASGFQGIQDC